MNVTNQPTSQQQQKHQKHQQQQPAKPVTITNICPTCDGDRRVLCHVCHGGSSREFPCFECGNRGDEPCGTCDSTGSIDPFADLREHRQFKRSHCSAKLMNGVLCLGYVHRGEYHVAVFRDLDVAEDFLDKLAESAKIRRLES